MKAYQDLIRPSFKLDRLRLNPRKLSLYKSGIPCLKESLL